MTLLLFILALLCFQLVCGSPESEDGLICTNTYDIPTKLSIPSFCFPTATNQALFQSAEQKESVKTFCDKVSDLQARWSREDSRQKLTELRKLYRTHRNHLGFWEDVPQIYHVDPYICERVRSSTESSSGRREANWDSILQSLRQEPSSDTLASAGWNGPHVEHHQSRPAASQESTTYFDVRAQTLELPEFCISSRAILSLPREIFSFCSEFARVKEKWASRSASERIKLLIQLQDMYQEYQDKIPEYWQVPDFLCRNPRFSQPEIPDTLPMPEFCYQRAGAQYASFCDSLWKLKQSWDRYGWDADMLKYLNSLWLNHKHVLPWMWKVPDYYKLHEGHTPPGHERRRRRRDRRGRQSPHYPNAPYYPNDGIYPRGGPPDQFPRVPHTGSVGAPPYIPIGGSPSQVYLNDGRRHDSPRVPPQRYAAPSYGTQIPGSVPPSLPVRPNAGASISSGYSAPLQLGSLSPSHQQYAGPPQTLTPLTGVL